MNEFFRDTIALAAFFGLLGYFFIGAIKRDVVFALRYGYNSGRGLRFRGVNAVIISIALAGFLLYGFFTLPIPSYGVFQYILGIIIGLPTSYGFYKFSLNIHETTGTKASKKQFVGDYIFWIIFGVTISLLCAFFGYMISRSILITIAVFLVPFLIIALLGYAFAKFNSGR